MEFLSIDFNLSIIIDLFLNYAINDIPILTNIGLKNLQKIHYSCIVMQN